MALPGVAAISVRGTSPLPPSMLPPDTQPLSTTSSSSSRSSSPGHFHWGDDLRLDQASGDIDPDPGFDAAAHRIMTLLVKGVLVDALGWEMRDIMLFGFGQGGSLALGIASRLRTPERVVDLEDGGAEMGMTTKGVVSIGGPLPGSMVPSLGGRRKSDTPVLVVQLDGNEVDRVRREFGDVRAVNWRSRDVSMPRNREEMFPLMKFFADQLNKPY
ncbi:hypothetical protein ESCO_000579 [Escovopsis weberi]|uniref:Phospholipase/carboxylesterase/thioesterase domain-containing protein n=1 Tax=Escovopsis weberi TaxID=150374 RepID=A0A0M9VUD0_ESCWE|nr:hypothetical protein ESCO_000579 [Escovopsis weberi]